MRTETLVTDRGFRLRAKVPETGWERARGLLGRDSLAPETALFLERARSIHTVGMRFVLGIAFLDAHLRVLHIVRVPPGRLLVRRRGARHVLELRPDVGLRAGDRVTRLGPTSGRDPALGTARRILALYFRGCPRVGGAGSSAPIV